MSAASIGLAIRARRRRAFDIERLECRLMLDGQPLERFPSLIGAEVFTSADLQTPGLVGSYVDRSLRTVTSTADWRTTQTVAGTRVDGRVDFAQGRWGAQGEVGLTGGTHADWNNFAVQWDGYLRIDAPASRAALFNDDGARLWIDVNGDGVFSDSAPEMINNGWGTARFPTHSARSSALAPGVYAIRLQYDNGPEDTVRLRVDAIADHVVRVVYVIPSGRVPQAHAVGTLQAALPVMREWYADQMERAGFGPKTFTFETMEDGATPKVWTVGIEATDAEVRTDMWEMTLGGAADAGVPIWTPGQVWLLVSEAHLMAADGSIAGGVALGASNGSGSNAGVATTGGNGLAILNPQGLTDDSAYAGRIFPDVGPYPLVQNTSYPSFEGTTVSSLTSSHFGAMLHEISHAFGLPHDFRNDENFRGVLMGNGFRGMRGAIHPDLYPGNDTYLSHGQAMALNVSRYFNAWTAPENTMPTAALTTSGTVALSNGLLPVSFTASDASGLAVALLRRGGELIAEMPLSGTSVSRTFLTPYFTKGTAANFEINVYDVWGNRRDVSASLTPATGANAAPRPVVKFSPTTLRLGQVVTLGASSTTDPDHAANTLTFEWDLDGDGTFDTAPSASNTLATSFDRAGTRLVYVRVTDPAGARAVSMPVPARVSPSLLGTAGANRYYVRVDPSDAEQIEIFASATPVGAPMFRVPTGMAGELVLDLQDGADEVTVDLANGKPWTAGGLRVLGGAGDDVLNVVGSAGDDDIEFAGGIGSDRINVAGGAYAFHSDAGAASAGLTVHVADGASAVFHVTQHLAGLELAGTAAARLVAGGVRTLFLGSLAMDAAARLDLSDHDLVLISAAEDLPSRLAALNALVASGRNAGTGARWSGAGITSSSARADLSGLTGLVVVPTSDGVLVKYSWAADADGDEVVTVDDYHRVDRGFLGRKRLFHEGDLDFDSVVDLEDYAVIDAAYLAPGGVPF